MQSVHKVQRIYSVATEVYQGPLDLLLQLIERTELDITKLALAEVTNSFLEHVRGLKNLQAEEISNFLAVAARLMQIKSEALLPRPPEREPGEVDTGDDLIYQLVLYKRYKEISRILSSRLEFGQQTFFRLADPPKIEGKLDLSEVTLQDLHKAARTVFINAQIQANKPSPALKPPTITIREKINAISTEIKKRGHASFKKLIGKHPSRVDVVVTFLALLELVKQFQIQAKQSDLFGDIEIEPAESWNDESDFELEFSD